MNREQINSLAIQYCNGDPHAFSDLLYHLRPMIRKEARKWTRIYGGDMADFESEFHMAAWQAVQGYDGSSDFISRFRFFLNRRGADWKRKLETEKREMESMAVSLDAPLDESEEDHTLYDVLSSPESVEDEVIAKEMTVDFGAVNRQAGVIINLLTKGVDNMELARSLGAKSYDSNIRKKVQRAKHMFKKYLLA